MNGKKLRRNKNIYYDQTTNYLGRKILFLIKNRVQHMSNQRDGVYLFKYFQKRNSFENEKKEKNTKQHCVHIEVHLFLYDQLHCTFEENHQLSVGHSVCVYISLANTTAAYIRL